MSMDTKLILDISKAIDASSGFAQAIETQDLEPKVTNAAKGKKKKVKDDGDEKEKLPD